MNLSQEQQDKIINEWNSRPENPPSLKELVKVVFPEKENLDGRSEEGRLVKEFLSGKQIKARASQEYLPKNKIELTEERKEFIRNNLETMSFVDMARTLFNDKKITNLSQESRTVQNIIEES